ncbi:ATP-binding protein [Phenylobacterium sp.]|uniref:ATP-binding protein n=1 Tax=Phenylobacterium sp. TaxID=1871053 RepID=UPI0025E2C473|nr:ATP-binding protein [Phenylobacterium sp.]
MGRASQRLSARLTLAYGGLFAGVLVLIFSVLAVAAGQNVQDVVRDELNATATAFERIWHLRSDQLQRGALVLSRDFGFRGAVTSQDAPTLQSALENARERLSVDLVLAIDLDGRLMARSGSAQRIDDATLRSLAASDQGGVLLIDKMPYQTVTAPILAPNQIGQLVFAVRLDDRELASLAELSPVRVKPQVVQLGAGGRWQGGDGHLTAAEIRMLRALGASKTARPGLTIDGNVEVMRRLPSTSGRPTALILRYPLDKALAPYRLVLAIVLGLGAAGLCLVGAGSWWVARRITRPLDALRAAAEQLEGGAHILVEVRGRDEIADLGRTFNRMTDRIVRREAALKEARVLADAANQAKTDFLANMSHEIRTPLNGILGMAQVLDRDDLRAEQRQRVGVIRNTAHVLLAILNSILDLSKIEAGQLEVETQPFDLKEVLDRACEPFANLAAETGLAFRIDLDPAAAGWWAGDALRLQQTIANLASNAVKFTEAGGVTCLVRFHDGALRFRVEDSGVGIPPEQMDLIFDKFSQGDSSATRRFGGAGVGLAICRELVRLMGGVLRADSRPGAGSAFWFDLPLAAAQPPEDRRMAAPVEGEPALRILAAEDNPTNQMILKALLEPLGVDLTVAPDGQAAVEAAAAGGYDLILMDIQMPKLSGVEATRRIRAGEAAGEGPRTPIVAVTANVAAHELQAYRDAGMDGVVAKPIAADVLYAAIEAALVLQTRDSFAEAASRSA